jgi:hypothetical protein
MINMQLTKLQEVNLDISKSEAEEDSHFQTHAFQFTQLEKVFELHITELFKQSHGVKSVDLDLREIILLDSQSTMDLFCNQALIGNSFKANTSMHLQSNGRTMMVMLQACVPGYHKPIWFKKSTITNIITLKNLIQQYCVMYNSVDKTFVVH